jgi:hypothetical protein
MAKYITYGTKYITYGTEFVVDGAPTPPPPTALDVSGGTVTYDGDYAIHTFDVSSSVTITGSGYAQVLWVGGGAAGRTARGFVEGDGDGYAGGGGGGGQVIEDPSILLTAGVYEVIVGVGSIYNGHIAGKTSFFGIEASAGLPQDGLPRGQGTTSGAGFQGATARNLIGSAGGGGGASAVGSQGSAINVGGIGGNGVYSSITGSQVGYGGGGDGGGVYRPRNAPTDFGGGIGGNGFTGTAAGDGIDGRGGGGGGASKNGTTGQWAGGNGGSGVVIIRYKYQ